MFLSSAKLAPDTVQIRFRFGSPGILIQFVVPFLWFPLGGHFKRMLSWVAQFPDANARVPYFVDVPG